MIRCLATVVIVASVSYAISLLEQANGQNEFAGSRFDTSTWVRTADGWESPSAWESPGPVVSRPTLHPLLVTGFQLSASLFALVAFPGALSAAERRRAETDSEAGTLVLQRS